MKALKRKTIIKALLAFALVCTQAWSFAPRAWAQAGPDAADHAPRLISSDATGLTLELSIQAQDFSIEQANLDGEACQKIRIQGFASTDQAGWPELPTRAAMLGIPLHSTPDVSVTPSKAVGLPGRFNLCPVEPPHLDQELPDELAPAFPAAPLRNSQVYSTNQFVPSSPAELVSTAMIRSQRVALVRFQPFQYNPVTGELRYYPRLLVRLSTLNPGASQEVSPSQNGRYIDEGAFEPLLSQALINYEMAQPWRAELSHNPAPRQAAEMTSLPSYKILMSQDGIYQVTYEALAAIAGADLTPGQPSNSFRLFANGDPVRGVEVAIQVIDGGDGAFDPGDAILFYGQKIASRYTAANTYFLTWGGGASGSRMASVDGAPGAGNVPDRFMTTSHMEVDRLYRANYPSGNDDDVWYWDSVLGTSTTPVSKNFQVTLNNIYTTSPVTATMRGLLRCFGSSSQHHTQIYLNSNLIGDYTWAPYSQYQFEVQFPQAYLLNGVNTLTVKAPMDNGITQDKVLINWFEVDYWDSFVAENDRLDFKSSASDPQDFHISGFTTAALELFDATNPLAPVRVTGFATPINGSAYELQFAQASSGERRYLAQSPANRLSPTNIIKDYPSNLHASTNSADYILITHPDFYTAVLPLRDWRASQGLRTQVVDVTDIYDEFGAGRMNPQAIHDFLAYAYANWQPPAPMYVLLVGDGNYDPLNFYATGEATFIPPYLARVDNWLGETASDNRFVTVSGSDNLPDMFLGRITAKTSAQAAAVVTKILTYEQNPPSTSWNANVMFVADNSDSAGDFAYYSDKVVNNLLPVSYTAQKIYYGITHTSVSTTRTAILDGINNGALIVNYVGHGSMQYLASENLFGVSSVDALTNSDRLPFVASMACLAGSFQYPSAVGTDNSALAEKLVLSPNKGAIASFSSAGMGLASGQDYLDQGLFQAIFSAGWIQVGAAAVQAKLYLYSTTGGYQDLIDTYTLFGDPATQLKVLQPPVASLGDRVWNDQNANGLQDAGEPGLAGVSVALHAGNGNLVATTTTGVDGLYAFNDIAPGNYYLVFTPPAGYIFSPQNQGADNSLDSDTNPATGQTAITPLVASENDLTLDAGMTVLVDLSTRISADKNPVTANNQLNYQIVVTNQGPSVAENVVISDTLPLQSVNFISASLTPNQGTNPISWNLGNLAAGQAITLTVTTNVLSQAQEHFTNKVVVHSNSPETVVENNTSEVVTNFLKTTAVDVTYFEVTTISSQQAQITWSYVNAVDLLSGFKVYRAPANNPTLAEVIHYQEAEICQQEYSVEFVDNPPHSGMWWYWLVVIHADGSESWSLEPVMITLGSQYTFLPMVTR